MNKDQEQDNKILKSIQRYPLTTPKFSAARWESGEGGHDDQGESPTDNVTG
jgi:hypothetical protein